MLGSPVALTSNGKFMTEAKDESRKSANLSAGIKAGAQ
jgi:hypothetical protein